MSGQAKELHKLRYGSEHGKKDQGCKECMLRETRTSASRVCRRVKTATPHAGTQGRTVLPQGIEEERKEPNREEKTRNLALE